MGIPRTTPAEIENPIQQIRATNLDPGSKDKIERLLRTVLTLVDMLGRRKTSINKLRELIFGWRTEKHHKKSPMALTRRANPVRQRRSRRKRQQIKTSVESRIRLFRKKSWAGKVTGAGQ